MSTGFEKKYNSIEVTIVIPSRNEELYIKGCLDSVLSQDFPKEKMEVLVVDGMSDDDTPKIVRDYIMQYPFIRLLDNPKRVVSAALNVAIRRSRGRFIIRLDAHAVYNLDYVSRCVCYLRDHNVDNVGGLWIILPSNKTTIAKAIASALSHKFGVGNAVFRVGSKDPCYVDTVPFGCYKKEIFKKIGLFDEELVRNQDDEFNLRLIKNGGRILLDPKIISYYYARDSIAKLWKMYFQYGYFKPLVAKKIGAILTWRQLIPPMFISSLIIAGILSLFWNKFLWILLLIIILYLSCNLLFSFIVALKKELKLLTFIPICFAVLHFSYGIGYLKGIWDFVLCKKHSRGKINDIPLTR